MDEPYSDVRVVVVCLVEILVTIRPLNGERQCGLIGQFVQESSIPQKDVLMPAVSLVLRDSTRKIVTFIVEIQLQFEMRHQFGVAPDCKEMMHIREILFGLGFVPTVG